MPLQYENIELPIGGLGEKQHPLLRQPGALDRAVNVEFDKTGALNKRAGYRVVLMSNVVGCPVANDVVMQHVATRRDELLVFTHDHVLGLASPEAALRGADSFVYRGPCNRGNVKLQYVATSRTSRQQPANDE